MDILETPLTRWANEREFPSHRGRPPSVDEPGQAGSLEEEPILAFVHLAKTGGVTLSGILQRNFSAANFLRINQETIGTSALGTWAPADIAAALGRLTSKELIELEIGWGHFPGHVDQYLPRASCLITLLRDPVDRLVSAYYYVKAREEAKGKPLSVTFEEYVCRKEHYDLGFENYMTRVISGIPELDPFEAGKTTGNSRAVAEADFAHAAARLQNYMLVGTTDRFDEMLVVLAEDRNWPLEDLVYTPQNITPRRPSLEEIPSALIAQIEGYNQFDRALYQQAGRLLDRRIAKYRGEFSRSLAIFREINRSHTNGVEAAALK